MGLAAINIKFTADLRGFSTEMQNSIRRIGALGKELQGVGQNLSTYVSLPLVAAGAAAIKFASDYNESLNKVDVAFGTSSNSVKEFAKTSLENFGIAEGSALDMAATYGDMATALGLPVEKASAMSKSLVGLAGDLASFKNISVDVANTALAGIFTGETESLKKLGIVMTEANLQAYALSEGITKQFKDMSQAEKVGLRYNYILSVTKNSQGDFARTGGGAANQMRIFQESLKQVGQQLGSVILPAFTKLITYVNNAIKSFSGLSDETKTTIVVIAGIAAAIGPLLTGFGSLLTFVPNLITKFNSLKTAFSGLTAIIAANPYTALAIGIAAIAGGLYLWYSNTQKTVTAQQSLQNAIEAGNKAASSEVGALDRLYASSTNVKSGINERKEAYKSLQELYPAYFKNIDFENLKNAQSVGIYKELREAIFNKSRAKAIDNELQKRAEERITKELELQNKIAATNAEILRIKKATTDTVIKGSAAEKTNDIVIKRTDQLAAQNRLLKIQQNDLDVFTQNALNSDKVLLDSKAQYDAKSAKLTENEIQRQKDLIAANALVGDSVAGLKTGTISYYENLISIAQKAQKEVALNGKEWADLQLKIDGYQKKIDAIEGKGPIKLPKPELPSLGATEQPFMPSFSLQDLKGQQAYFEKLREQYSSTDLEYKNLTDNINNTEIKIKAIEGTEDFTATLDTMKSAALDFGAVVSSAFQSFASSALESFSTMVGNLVSGKGNLDGFFSGIIGLIGDFLSSIGKALIAYGVALIAFDTAAVSNPFVALAAGAAAMVLAQVFKNVSGGGLKGYANGGIVGGSSFYGDKILARVNSGELILNNQQQKSVHSMLSNGGAGSTVNLNGNWEISGSMIRFVLDRDEAIRNRTR